MVHNIGRSMKEHRQQGNSYWGEGKTRIMYVDYLISPNYWKQQFLGTFGKIPYYMQIIGSYFAFFTLCGCVFKLITITIRFFEIKKLTDGSVNFCQVLFSAICNIYYISGLAHFLAKQVETKISNYEEVYSKSPNTYNKLDQKQSKQSYNDNQTNEVTHHVEEIYGNGIYISTKVNGSSTKHFAASAPQPMYEECPPKNKAPPLYPRISRTVSNTLIEMQDHDKLIEMHQQIMDKDMQKKMDKK